MTKQQGFLATFRIDEELWGKFKDIAKNKQTNASALIIQYIQGVVSSGGVDNVPQSTPQNIDNLPKLSIQDIEKIIDEKINSSIQAIDNIPTQSIQNIDDINRISIQDIDDRIVDSIKQGDIKDAISTSYAAMMGQFNGLLQELQDLKSQLQELQSIPPALVSNPQIIEHLTTDNGQITEDELTEIKSDNSPALPEKNQIDYVQKQLKKIGIKKSAGEIREAFINAGFDGNNYEVLRGELIESLSKE